MKIFLIIITTLLLASCADNVTLQHAIDMNQVGFWYGIWHGMILPFSFIGSIFSDNISIYAIYNNGIWYNFGYIIGIFLLRTYREYRNQ